MECPVRGGGSWGSRWQRGCNEKVGSGDRGGKWLGNRGGGDGGQQGSRGQRVGWWA